MEKPLPFILENQGKLELNEELLKIIEKSKNPRLLLFYGSTRQGKSTTLNQIIRGNIETWKYINKSPFQSQTSQKSLTVGCDIYGPVKCSEIQRRHKLNIKLNEDFDIFFCDTEGLFSLNGQSKILIPGILTLLQVCTLSVIMINTVPDVNTISQITSEIQFSKILQQINKDLQSPLVAIYISGYQVDIVKYNDFETCKEMYESERDETIELIIQNIKEKYKHLNITKKDFKVIPGGPYEHNNDKEPDHEDLKAQLYWHSINEIAKQFIIHTNKTPSYSVNKLISLIRIVFDIFKSFTELPEGVDLKDILIKYITKSFEEYSNGEFNKINEEIKKDLKKNYGMYYKMLIDNNSAMSKLNQCIEESKIEIYKTLIPEKIKNFTDNALLRLRKSIESQFEEEFSKKNKEILSDKNINAYIHDIVEEINKANFREDIDMNIVKNYSKIWNIIEKENEGLFTYFLEKKPTSLDNLKKNFNNSIEKIVNSLISQKKVWKIFFQEKQAEIKEEINKRYSELFRAIQYQEDFNKLIKPDNELSEELVKKYNEKYFKNLEDKKKNEIITWIKETCKIEYNKLKQENSRKPKWENIVKNINSTMLERIQHYIESKFNGKFFRNEIDPDLGRYDVISHEILKDLNQIQEFPPEKQKEINILINKNITSAVSAFNKKREQLPLFDDIISTKEKLCNQIADEKIKELLNKFVYSEDKITFNEDNFYTLFKQNKNINLNIPQNNLEFDNMIRKVSKIKSEEYNNILVPKKPKWNKDKENMRKIISDICEKYIKEVTKNKSFKEEVKFDIEKLDKEINSLNLFNGIEERKQNEIREMIKRMEEETRHKIINIMNNLSNWSETKNLHVNKGKEIMMQKLESNLKTKDLNEIINILIEEVRTYPRFCDFLKDKKYYDQVFGELRKIAEELGKKYINQKVIEEQKRQENQKKLNELREAIEEKEKMKRQLEIKIQEEKRKAEEERKRREQEERKRKEEEERRRKAEEEARRIREEEERRRREEIEARNRAEQERQRACFPRCPYGGCSIVDGLKSIGANSSYGYRCAIAARNGIGGYVGSPQQNTHMLNLLKNGNLLRP